MRKKSYIHSLEDKSVFPYMGARILHIFRWEISIFLKFHDSMLLSIYSANY